MLINGRKITIRSTDVIIGKQLSKVSIFYYASVLFFSFLYKYMNIYKLEKK